MHRTASNTEPLRIWPLSNPGPVETQEVSRVSGCFWPHWSQWSASVAKQNKKPCILTNLTLNFLAEKTLGNSFSTPSSGPPPANLTGKGKQAMVGCYARMEPGHANTVSGKLDPDLRRGAGGLWAPGTQLATAWTPWVSAWVSAGGEPPLVPCVGTLKGNGMLRKTRELVQRKWLGCRYGGGRPV